MAACILLAHSSALAAAVIFGMSTVAVRAIVHDVPPVSLEVLRIGQAALVLFLLVKSNENEQAVTLDNFKLKMESEGTGHIYQAAEARSR